ncbi:MAG: extracellular solute-binding protein [Planctomycetes bacterium]|nr:extracellular solute-binding protein [Planctomycetota bacterium]
MRCRTPLLLSLLAACGADALEPAARPTIYVALDQQFSEPLLNRFAQELQIDLVQRHDSEAAKTVGLVSALLEERGNPRCTVFWNNELAHTVRLAQAGLLEPYDSPVARDVPAAWRDPLQRWTGFAARARILVVNTELLPDPKTWPTSYADLVDPKWKGRCGVAKPKTGTTLTHFTALRQLLGDEAFTRFLDGLFTNEVKLLAGNGASLREVRDGKLAWAFTDTDDYHVAKSKGFPVACVFPDQHDGGVGTMLIPNSVALIKGGPNQAAGKQLIDKILARETEALLAAAEGAQIPLREGVKGPDDPAILPAGTFRAMQWDVEWTAANLSRCLIEWEQRFGS